jgi:hypothetical protein
LLLLLLMMINLYDDHCYNYCYDDDDDDDDDDDAVLPSAAAACTAVTATWGCQAIKAVVDKIKAAGGAVELFMYDGCGHAFMNALTPGGQAKIKGQSMTVTDGHLLTKVSKMLEKHNGLLPNCQILIARLLGLCKRKK